MRNTSEYSVKSIVGLVLLITAFWFIWPFIHQKLNIQPAPDFSYKTLTGIEKKRSSDLGQPLIIHFWATWCPVCKHEMPEFKRLEQHHKVLHIAGDSGSNLDVLRFAENNSMTPAIIINDQYKQIQNLYHVIGFPTTVIVDPEGMVQFRKVGKIHFQEINQIIETM